MYRPIVTFCLTVFAVFQHETPKSMLPYYEVCKTVWIQIAVEMSYQFWHKEIFFAKKYFDIFYQLNANLYPLSRICVQLFSLFYLDFPYCENTTWFKRVCLWLEFDSQLEMGGFTNAFCFLFRLPYWFEWYFCFKSWNNDNSFIVWKFVILQTKYWILYLPYLFVSIMHEFIHSFKIDTQ